MNSYNSFRQKLILDANDRKKKLKFELKVTDVHFAKNEKKNNQKFEQILTKNRELLKFVKLIELAVVI